MVSEEAVATAVPGMVAEATAAVSEEPEMRIELVGRAVFCDDELRCSLSGEYVPPKS